jgi:hypothetical protein
LSDNHDLSPPATELLRQLYAAGLRVRVEEGTLRVGPKSSITPDFAARIRQLKLQLLEILSTHRCSLCGWGIFSKPTICFHCRKAIAELEGEAYAEDVLRAQAAEFPMRKKRKTKKAEAA